MDVEFLKYKFEDGFEGIAVKTGFKPGVRHLQLLYMAVCSSVLGAVRGSMPVAVLMTFPWDRRTQGLLLSSFLFGYALMIIPAELCLRKTGGKLMLTASLIVNGALTVAMPTIANSGGWIAVYNALLILGATQACVLPANQSLLNAWLPPSERGVFNCVLNAGTLVGTIIGLPISGMIATSRLSWKLVFYSQGMMTISMAAIWVLLTASTPEGHQAIGDEEKEYIKESMGCYLKKSLHLPWGQILKSRQFWAVTCAHAASNAVFVFCLVDLPAYFMGYGTSLEENTLKSIFPFISLVTVYYMTSPSAQWVCRLLHKGLGFSVTRFRKIVNAFGVSGVLVGLSVLPSLAPDWKRLSVAMITGVAGCVGFQYSGFLESFKDMSQNFGHSQLMISRLVAALCGGFVPLVSGVVVGDDILNPKKWQVVLLSLATFYAMCNVIYTIFGSSRRQEWDGGTVVKNMFGYQYNNNIGHDNDVELNELNSDDGQPKEETKFCESKFCES